MLRGLRHQFGSMSAESVANIVKLRDLLLDTQMYVFRRDIYTVVMSDYVIEQTSWVTNLTN